MAPSTLIHFCSLLLLLQLLPFLPTVFTYSEEDCNRQPKLPLRANQETNSLMVSPLGEFAFGFHPLPNNGKENQYLLAVWFNKIENKTIVWSANGNETAPEGSELKQNSESQFVLEDTNGKVLWKAPTLMNGSKSSCAAILDNGNLVILDEQYNAIWESFNEPTDTILPGQTLRKPSKLRSRQSETNYSDGRFQLSLQMDGNLVLYSVSMPFQNPDNPYYAMDTTNWGSQLIFTEAGYMYIIDGGNGRNLSLTKEDPGSNETYYHIARIDHDGVFRIYKHLRKKDETSGGSCPPSWTEVQGIPEDICQAFVSNTNTIGGGLCGPNSLCSNDGPRAMCTCPPGFSALDQSDDWAGCTPDFALPSCQKENRDLVEFKELIHVNWPFSDYQLLQGPEINRNSCENHCRDDCLCVVAIYYKDSCWKKKYPLSNGRKDPSIPGIVLIKVPKNNDLYKKKQSLVVVLALLLGSSAFLNILLFLAIFAACYYLYHKKLNLPWNIDSSFATNVRSYTYKELEEATRDFKHILGKGAFGTVYKGVLGSDSKRYVAVKKLDKVVEEGEKEFTTEVSVIGQTHHKNLVRLLGYCDEGEHRLLVYEYMSKGSLATFLFGISRPHWNQRVQIAFGIARGLMYLHEECSTQIIHCDIKPQNILLDDYFTPRIADFGLAKLLLAEQTRAARTGIRGTIGYFAPEWFRKASISVKVDVYSFGVMLLEIICCKSSVAFAMGEEEALIDWAYECYKDKKLEKLIENDEEARNDMKRLERLVIVAIWCIQEDPSLRPSMKKVTQMLEGVIEVSVPPRPSLYASSPPSKMSSSEFSLSTIVTISDR